MYLTLKLNARFQPKHRFELEDALQIILEKEQMEYPLCRKCRIEQIA